MTTTTTTAAETGRVELRATKRAQPALRMLAHCMEKESTRYAISGVLVEVRGGRVVLGATDGRGMFVVEVFSSGKGAPGFAGTEAPDGSDFQAIVPGDTFRAWVRECTTTRPSVLSVSMMRRDGRELGQFRLAQRKGGEMIGDCLEGSFPRWREVVPVLKGYRVVDSRPGVTIAGSCTRMFQELADWAGSGPVSDWWYRQDRGPWVQTGGRWVLLAMPVSAGTAPPIIPRWARENPNVPEVGMESATKFQD